MGTLFFCGFFAQTSVEATVTTPRLMILLGKGLRLRPMLWPAELLAQRFSRTITWITTALGWVACGLGTRPNNVIQQSRPPVPVTLRKSTQSRQDEDGWYHHATPRSPDMEVLYWPQQSSVERPSDRRTLLEQLLGIHPGNQFATASHQYGPRLHTRNNMATPLPSD